MDFLKTYGRVRRAAALLLAMVLIVGQLQTFALPPTARAQEAEQSEDSQQEEEQSEEESEGGDPETEEGQTVNEDEVEDEEPQIDDGESEDDQDVDSTEPDVTEVSEDVEEETDGLIEVSATTTESSILLEDEYSQGDVPVAPTSTATSTDATTIVTGDSVAAASVVNMVNTNLTNSEGVILFLNNLFSAMGSVDLRSLPFFQTDGAYEVSSDAGCDDVFCMNASSDVVVINSNAAEITNDLIVRAQTGSNDLETDGDGLIDTGDAYAVADVVNIANTNITDSQYALIVVNNFGDWFEDFIFPGLAAFQQFFTGGGFSGTATNDNTALIENNASVSGQTGNNGASGETALITAGDSYSAANIINTANSNMTGGQSLAVVFRIHGDWFGDAFNVPEGVVWNESSNSIELYLDPSFYAGGSSGGSGTFNVQNTNDALVRNNVGVYALTGDNHVEAGGSATVSTGNAYAAANIVNVVNTNVLSRNWIYAIVNVFGDWYGNISFGRPDLWVAGWAEHDDEYLRPGSKITYRYTVTNQGDAPASGIRFDSNLDTDHMYFSSDNGPSSEFSLPIESLGPGEVREFSVDAIVGDSMPNEVLATNTFSVSLTEADNNGDDNEDFISVTLNQEQRSSGSSSRKPTAKERKDASHMPELVVEKRLLAGSTTTVPAAIEYEVTVRNDSKYPAYNAVLIDILTAAEASSDDLEILNREEWVLDTILPYEEIILNYTVEFSEQTKPGMYENYAKVFAKAGENDDAASADSQVAETILEIVGGEVLGLQYCAAHLTGYIKPGANNNAEEVRKLQQFLNVYEQAGLPETGDYGNDTVQAVKEFQRKYASDVLDPWGILSPTGHVYYTTQRKVNEVVCGGETDFSLTVAQLDEMRTYKGRLARLESAVAGVARIVETTETQSKPDIAIVSDVPVSIPKKSDAVQSVQDSSVWDWMKNPLAHMFRDVIGFFGTIAEAGI